MLFIATVQVIAKGPGLERTGVAPNKWAEFTVDTRPAGKAPLHISCMDVDYKPLDVQVSSFKTKHLSGFIWSHVSGQNICQGLFGLVFQDNTFVRVYFVSCFKTTHLPGSIWSRVSSKTFVRVDLVSCFKTIHLSGLIWTCVL